MDANGNLPSGVASAVLPLYDSALRRHDGHGGGMMDTGGLAGPGCPSRRSHLNAGVVAGLGPGCPSCLVWQIRQQARQEEEEAGDRTTTG